MLEKELTEDIKDTLEAMNELYRGYIEQDEKEYKIALLISLRIGAVAIADAVVELKKILQNKFKKEPLTNFERVTESPEALAKWICEITDFCDRGCCRCPVEEKCLYDSDGAGNKDNEQLLVELLKEKSNCGEK